MELQMSTGPNSEIFNIASCSSNTETNHCSIINKANIEKMKDGVIIINNSRGQLVVEQDLAEALNSGKVLAAGAAGAAIMSGFMRD